MTQSINILNDPIKVELTNFSLSGVFQNLPHNELAGLQGGQAGEYYHFKAAELNALVTSIDAGAYHHHDARYYTEDEIGLIIAGYSDKNHNHDGVYSFDGHTHSGVYLELTGGTMSGDIDMAGHDILNIGNTSLTFQDGSKITSSSFGTDGKVYADYVGGEATSNIAVLNAANAFTGSNSFSEHISFSDTKGLSFLLREGAYVNLYFDSNNVYNKGSNDYGLLTLYSNGGSGGGSNVGPGISFTNPNGGETSGNMPMIMRSGNATLSFPYVNQLTVPANLVNATSGGLTIDTSTSSPTDGWGITLKTRSTTANAGMRILVGSTVETFKSLYNASGSYNHFSVKSIFPDNIKAIFGTGSDAEIYFDGTGLHIDTDIVAASDLTVDCGTAKTVVLEVPVYDDINFSVGRGKIPGTAFPNWAAFCGDSNNNAYQFGVAEKIDLGTEEMYHDWKEGTIITPHVHIVLSATINQEGGEKVQFRLYYSIGDVSGVMSAEGYVDGETTIANETAVRTHTLINLATIDLAAYHIGSVIVCQLHRIAKSAGGTELSSEPFVMNVGLHIQKDTLGSRQITTK